MQANPKALTAGSSVGMPAPQAAHALAGTLPTAATQARAMTRDDDVQTKALDWTRWSNIDHNVTVHAGRVLLGVQRWAAEAFILHELGWGHDLHVYAFDPRKSLAKRSQYGERDAWIARAYPDKPTSYDLNVQVRMWLHANGYEDKSACEALLEHSARCEGLREALRAARERAQTYTLVRDGVESKQAETSPVQPAAPLATPPSKKRKHASPQAYLAHGPRHALASGFPSQSRHVRADREASTEHHPASERAASSATHDEAALVMAMVAQGREEGRCGTLQVAERDPGGR